MDQGEGQEETQSIAMRLHEIEAWVLDIADRVQSGHPVEDSRVELKAK